MQVPHMLPFHTLTQQSHTEHRTAEGIHSSVHPLHNWFCAETDEMVSKQS